MDPTRVAGAIMSFEDTLAGDKLLWGLGGSFGKNMKTISKHFGERVAVCAKHPTTRCEEWWEGTLQLSKNDRVIVLKYAARWNDEIDDLNDVDAHDDGLSDHTLEKRFDADDVVNVRRLTAEEDGDLLDGADDAVSKLRTPPADAPGRGVNVDFTWKIENVSAFRGILETRKLFSRFFPAGGVNLRLGAYESFDTLCVYLESDQGSTPSAMKNKTTPPGGGGGGAIGEGGKIGTGGGDGGGGGDGDGDYWVRYRVAVTNQKHPDRTKWKDATTSSKRWTSNVIQFMPTEDLTHPEGGYLVKDSIALAVEVLDVCYFNPDVDDGGSGFSKGDVAGAASMLPAIMKAAMNENAAEALRCVLYTGPHTTRRRGERRSLRTFPSASLRPPLAFNPRPRRLSTPTDAFELHPDVRSYGTTLRDEEGVCELFAWLWLGGGASGTSCTTTNGEDIGLTARWRKKMETREDPVYGDGFRAAKAGYDRCGRDLARFLERVRRDGKLP